MMTSSNGKISALLALCAGNSPVMGEFPSQRSVTRDLMFSLICARTKGWVDNRESGDLRRHRIHYDVTVAMRLSHSQWQAWWISGDVRRGSNKNWLRHLNTTTQSKCVYIAVTSRLRYVLWNHRQLDCLFNSWIRKTTPRLYITAPL